MHLFNRYQATSFIATVVDFGVLIACVELLKIWYVTATAIGALCGGVVSFLLNYYWVFIHHQLPLRKKIYRHIFIIICSLLLNTGLVFLLTNFGHIEYIFSKIISATLICIFFNFQMHKHYVFK